MSIDAGMTPPDVPTRRENVSDSIAELIRRQQAFEDELASSLMMLAFAICLTFVMAAVALAIAT